MKDGSIQTGCPELSHERPARVSRRLTVSQKAVLLRSARRYRGQKISITHIPGDVEGETLAGDIVDVLRRAGWIGLDGFGVGEASLERDQTGILVDVNRDDATATAAGQMLLESLQSFGIASTGGNKDHLRESAIALIVGRKPPSAGLLMIPVVTAHTAAVRTNPFVCSRPFPGDVVTQPAELRSKNGVLEMGLALYEGLDVQGLKVFCYLTATGAQSPTVRVRPGDELILTLKNELSTSFDRAHVHAGSAQSFCSGAQMNPSSTNLHFHGWSIPPVCHQDETLRTVIQPSDPAFEYRVRIPKDQPPGLYWYHPHPHGFTEGQVLGGASGALIVEGIEQKRPDVAGLPERVLVLRDQSVAGLEEAEESSGPGKDTSLNFVPVQSPLYRPAEMPVIPGQREFWRVLNASADTYFDLQVQVDKIPQPIKVVALDGVPVGAKQGLSNHLLLAPGARAEFIVRTPAPGGIAQFVTLPYDRGPDGAATPYRVIATVRGGENASPVARMPSSKPERPGSFKGLAGLMPAERRKLYFSEDLTRPKEPKYFITLDGATPKTFAMDFTKPDVVVRQGTVEDWVIENRAREAHAFHIHQLHFQVLERDGRRVNEAALRDTIDLPYWDGKSIQYPSVKLRMDFRNPEIVGTFVFHCHILEHEDGGMMGSIQVVPQANRP